MMLTCTHSKNAHDTLSVERQTKERTTAVFSQQQFRASIARSVQTHSRWLVFAFKAINKTPLLNSRCVQLARRFGARLETAHSCGWECEWIRVVLPLDASALMRRLLGLWWWNVNACYCSVVDPYRRQLQGIACRTLFEAMIRLRVELFGQSVCRHGCGVVSFTTRRMLVLWSSSIVWGPAAAARLLG